MGAKAMRQLGVLLMAIFLGSFTWSQESQESEEPSESAAEETAEADAAEEDDDSDLDEQGFGEEDEDDFVPSQEVSADQSIPFPVDI